MKKNVNGICVEMSAEEVAAIERAVATQMAEDEKRPLTMEEVILLTIEKTVNSIEINDSTALRMVDYFPDYDAQVAEGKTVGQGFRFRYGGKLYRTEQPETVFNGVYAPGPGTESLYSEVTLPGDGAAPENAIAYSGNMALEEGLYYSQDGVVYRCIRSTGAPVFNALVDLVGIFVESA